MGDTNAPDGGPGHLRRLTRQDCLDLLRTRAVGRLAHLEREDVIAVVPVNHLLVEGEVVVRTGPGPKLQAAERGDSVSFQVDDVDEGSLTGWSVLVVGRATRRLHTGSKGPSHATRTRSGMGPARGTSRGPEGESP